MSGHDEALVEKAARTLAGLAPNEAWPTNEALGGSLTGTRDDEYRDAMRDDARAVLDAVADEIRAEGWDEAIEAVVWCLDNGEPSPAAALAYVHKNNPHRAALATGSEK